MKRIISILTIAVLITSMMTVTVFAHGHRMNGTGQQTRYALCAVDGCNTTGLHQHNGTWYRGPAKQQNTYEVCPVEGCTQLGLHEHDGVYYYCADHGTGHGCRKGVSQ